MPTAKKQDRLAPRIRRVKILFYIGAVLWLLLGTDLVLYMLLEDNGLSSALVGVFLFLNALGMFISGRYIGQRKQWAIYFGLVVLLVNASVTSIRQFGLFDLLAFILDVVLFIFILSMAGEYLKST